MKLKAELLFATLQLAGAMTFNKKGEGNHWNCYLFCVFLSAVFLKITNKIFEKCILLQAL